MRSRATLSLLSYVALVHAVPSRTLSGRASSCTFTSTASLAAGKDSCTDIVLDGIAVPAGETLDLTDLADGTSVTFQGTTTFGYEEWEGPLISVSGVNNIAVAGASGHVIDGDGARWWDGQGSNGGKTKPKFLAAHKLSASTITGLNVKNTPVQGFPINQAYDLVLQSITIDNAATTRTPSTWARRTASGSSAPPSGTRTTASPSTRAPTSSSTGARARAATA